MVIAHIRRIRTQRIHAYQAAFLIMAGIGIYLVRPASTYLWDHISALAFITYPQRFLGLVMFCLSVSAGLVAGLFTKRLSWIAIGMITVIILFEYPFVNLNYVRDSAESLSVRILDTTDVWGEFMPKAMPPDFIPNGRLRAQQPMITLTPPGPSPTCTQTSQSITCPVHTSSPATVRFRQFYFPGWTAHADTDSLPVTMHTDGTILVFLNKPTETVSITFIKTPLRVFSNFLSVIFLGLYILLGIQTVYTRIQKKPISS